MILANKVGVLGLDGVPPPIFQCFDNFRYLDVVAIRTSAHAARWHRNRHPLGLTTDFWRRLGPLREWQTWRIQARLAPSIAFSSDP